MVVSVTASTTQGWVSWIIVYIYFYIYIYIYNLSILCKILIWTLCSYYFRSLLSEDELKQLEEACDMALELNQSKHRIYEYVESRMSFIAPNLSVIVGASTAAKIMGERRKNMACNKILQNQTLFDDLVCLFSSSWLQVSLAVSLTSRRCQPVTWCCWELRGEPCLASAAHPCFPTQVSSTTVTSCSHCPLYVNGVYLH